MVMGKDILVREREAGECGGEQKRILDVPREYLIFPSFEVPQKRPQNH